MKVGDDCIGIMKVIPRHDDDLRSSHQSVLPMAVEVADYALQCLSGRDIVRIIVGFPLTHSQFLQRCLRIKIQFSSDIVQALHGPQRGSPHHDKLPVILQQFSTVSRRTEINSVCISWSAMISAFTGLNVPAPTCNVTSAVCIPFSRICSITTGVKCSPAVGAATDPSMRA